MDPFCNVCKKFFENRSALKRHVKCDTVEKDRHCKICHKWFRDSNGLRRHKETETHKRLKIYELQRRRATKT
jgi:hypothetical protein